MAYYGNTVRALIKVGATTVELLTQHRGSAEHTRHPLTWPWRVFLPSHPFQGHPGDHWDIPWNSRAVVPPMCTRLPQHHGMAAGWEVKKGSLSQA